MITTKAKDPRVAPVSWVIALTIAGGVLRGAALGHQSFWYDESVSGDLARAPLWDLLTGQVRDLGNPPLHPVLLRLWSLAFGDGDVALRSFSAVVGVLTIPVLFVVARRLAGVEVALVATAILALSPVHVSFRTGGAHLHAGDPALPPVRRDAPPLPRVPGEGLAFRGLCRGDVPLRLRALLRLLRGAGPARVRAPRAPAGSPAHPPPFDGPRRRGAPLPHLAPRALRAGHDQGQPWPVRRHLAPPRPLHPPRLRRRDDPRVGRQRSVFRVACALCAVASFGAPALLGASSLYRRRPAARLLLGWLLLPILVPILVSALLFPVYCVRYGLVASPAYVILVAAGLVRLAPRARFACVAGIAATTGLSLHYYYTTLVKHDFRDATSYVDAHVQSNDVIAFDADIAETVYRRYRDLRRARIRLVPPAPGGVEARFYGASREREPVHDVTDQVLAGERVWLVLSDAD